MSLTNALALGLPWFAAVPVVLLVLVATAAVRRLPAVTAVGRRLRLAATVAVGSLAMAGTVWQAFEITAATAVPRGNEVRPIAPDLRGRIMSLQSEISQLKQSTTTRTISADTAAKLSDYLASFGSRSVVVSCAPNDVEAYDYATQLTNLLKAANWDARGPEVTTIFGDVRAIGVNIYDAAGPGNDTAQILLKGLAKFNIPFETRVAPPSQASSDAAVELFVGAQPVLRAAAASDQDAQ